MNPLRFLVPAVLLLSGLWAPVGAAEVAAAEPQQVVRQFQDSLIAAMKAGGYASRYRLLEPKVTQAFDFDNVARVALGQYWSQLDRSQRNAFVDVFTQLSTATYASQFNTYSGERFSEPKAGKSGGGRAIVHSELIDAEDGTVSFTYQLRRSNGQWRIVNVIANGVSDLAMKRAEYTSVIRNSGFDDLLARLKQKVAQYGSGEAG